MGQFAIKRYSEILERMRNRVVSRTALTDLSPTGTVNQVLAAAAREDDDQYYQMMLLLDLFDISKASGSDLDDVAKVVKPDAQYRILASASSGTLVFSRSSTTGAVSIPKGTIVSVPSDSSIQFKTVADGSIASGATSSSAIPSVSLGEGSKYNVVAGAATAFQGKPSGVDTVSNPVPFTSGRDSETDDEFRNRIIRYMRSLSRGTVESLEGAVLGLVDTSTGKRVVYAKVVESISHLGNVTVYIDDGSGTAESYSSVSGEVVVASATGGEEDLYLAHFPVKKTSSYTVKKGGATLSEGTDYSLNAASGHVKLVVPLVAGETITADYSYYTGLIALAQKVIDGDPSNRDEYPGYRAAGVLVIVVSPTVDWLSVDADITTLSGWNQSDVIDDVKSAISSHINSLGIGEDVLVASLYLAVMSTPGVYDVKFTIPSADVVVGDGHLPRILLGSVKVH